MKVRPVTLRDYAATWLAGRDLSPSTRVLYVITLRNQILPALGDMAVTGITPAMVREWHARLRTQTGPTQRAHAYSLLRTILQHRGRRRGHRRESVPGPRRRAAKRARQIQPATLAELETIASAVAGPVQADGAAGRVVRAAVRGADGTAPLRHRREERCCPGPARRRPGRRRPRGEGPEVARRGSGT